MNDGMNTLFSALESECQLLAKGLGHRQMSAAWRLLIPEYSDHKTKDT